ncbi:hypothetical protein DPEC_G00215170 [Dallia pectoralis]|uniref:Uncharacterized protein n=1 Tax=Dallia pectoralis TaxID=75939 RepID=A0ACC2G2C8_DALPE|nr:hypothetical protein DPEC_G00215170 [Dallia pectoralis]
MTDCFSSLVTFIGRISHCEAYRFRDAVLRRRRGRINGGEPRWSPPSGNGSAEQMGERGGGEGFGFQNRLLLCLGQTAGGAGRVTRHANEEKRDAKVIRRESHGLHLLFNTSDIGNSPVSSSSLAGALIQSNGQM